MFNPLTLAPFSNFFRCQPALLYGFSSYLGASLALTHFPAPIAMAILVLPMLLAFHAKFTGDSLKRPLLALCIAAATFTFTQLRYEIPNTVPTGQGVALIALDDVVQLKTTFGKTWVYEATLEQFTYKGETVAKNLPVKLSLPSDPFAERPLTGFSYEIKAALKQGSHGGYYLSTHKKGGWIPADTSWSLSEWRYSAKKSAREYIQNSVSDPHAAAFLSGMFTGVFDDSVLSYELGRFGLQHLMAISGLHFSLLSAIIAFFCSLTLSKKYASVVVMLLMTAYFAFLGASPSVIRAWIGILIALTALCLEKRAAALNALGIGLFLISVWNPFMVVEIGFQFSFSVTAAILLLFAPYEKLLQRLFPKRPLNETAAMDLWDQHGYCILFFLRQAVALCLAVNTVALPLTLYHFHKFPLLSLAYNLFFPPMVSLSLFLLCLAMGIGWLSPLFAGWIHSFNEWYTTFLLNFAFNLPKSLDLVWQTPPLSPLPLILYFFALLIASIVLRNEREQAVSDHFV